MLRTKLNLLKTDKKYMILPSCQVLIVYSSLPHICDGADGEWRVHVREKWREEGNVKPGKVCTEIAGVMFLSSVFIQKSLAQKVWQYNTALTRDRRCNQSQMVLIILHRCTTQALSILLQKKKKWRWRPEAHPHKVHCGSPVNCVSLIGGVYV